MGNGEAKQRKEGSVIDHDRHPSPQPRDMTHRGDDAVPRHLTPLSTSRPLAKLQEKETANVNGETKKVMKEQGNQGEGIPRRYPFPTRDSRTETR